MVCPPLGSIVWARFGKTAWWPAVVVAENMTRTGLQPRAGYSCVLWLSSLEVSQVQLCYVSPFYCKLRQHTRKMSPTMADAVNIALQIEAERGTVDLEGIDDLLHWALAEGGYLELAKTSPQRFLPKPDDPIPEFVKGCLQQPLPTIGPGNTRPAEKVSLGKAKPTEEVLAINPRTTEKIFLRNARPTEYVLPRNTTLTEDIPGKARPTERISPEKARPTEKVLPVNNRLTEKVLPEKAQPTEKVLPVNNRPTEKVLPEKGRPTEKVLPVNNRPTRKVLPVNNRPTEKVLPEKARPTEKVLPVNNRPTEKVLPDKARPTEKVLPEKARPTEKFLPEKARPTEKVLPVNTRPTKKVLPVNTRPTEKILPENTRPTENVLPENTRPTEKVLPDKARPTEKVLPGNFRPTNKILPEKARPTVKVLPDKARPTEKVLPEKARPTEKVLPEKTKLSKKVLLKKAQSTEVLSGNTRLVETCPPLGSVVWARFGKTAWWPAVVIQEHMTQTGLLPRSGHSCVLWLSTLQVAQVKSCHVSPFYSKLRQQTRKMSRSMTEAIYIALKIEAERGRVHLAGINNLLDWGLADGGYLDLAEISADRFLPNPDAPIPEFVRECLQQDLMQHKVLPKQVDKPTARNAMSTVSNVTPTARNATSTNRDTAETAVKENEWQEDMDVDNVKDKKEQHNKHVEPIAKYARHTAANEKDKVSLEHLKARTENSRQEEGNSSQTVVKETCQTEGIHVDNVQNNHDEQPDEIVATKKNHNALQDLTTPTDKSFGNTGANEKDQDEEMEINDIESVDLRQGKHFKPTDKNPKRKITKQKHKVLPQQTNASARETSQISIKKKDQEMMNVDNVSDLVEQQNEHIKTARNSRENEAKEKNTALYIEVDDMEDIKKLQTNNENVEVDSVRDKVEQLDKDGDVEDLEVQSISCTDSLCHDSASQSCPDIARSIGTTAEVSLQLGSVVWARFGKTAWWPAVLVKEDMTQTRLQPRAGHSCVLWLSTLQVSQVKSCHVSLFHKKLPQHTRKMSRSMTEAVERALKIEAERGGVDLNEFTKLLDWGLTDGGYLELVQTSPLTFLPTPGAPIPDFVHDCLQQNIDNILAIEKELNKQVKCASQTAAKKTLGEVSTVHVEATAKTSEATTNGREIRGKEKGQEDMEKDHEEDKDEQGQEELNIEDCPPLGSVVWARFGKTSFWPAVVVAEHMTKTGLQPRAGHRCVMWLSSLDVSQVKSCHVSPFYIQLWQRARKMSRSMTEAVKRALKIEAVRGGVDLEGIEDLLDWGLADGGYLELAETSPQKFLPSPDAPIPEFIQECLQHLHQKIISGQVRQARPTDVEEEKVEEGVEIPSDSCMVCCSGDPAKHGHPFFEGNLCTPCKEHFETCLFATDTDGSGCFCLVCGEGGKLLVCDCCLSTFCTRCVIKYIGRKKLAEIEEQESWECFLCTDYDIESHGRLQTRSNTLIEMAKFSDHHYVAQPHGFPNFVESGKRKIRVLSLYDGIGTGKVVLEQLGFEVDMYYSCEIGRHAMALASHAGGVQQLGSVENLTMRKLKSICPLDLVLGGPPCDDLSIVNPARKGFDGTGIHIVYFIKILLSVQRLCRETNHVFYMMENTGNMPREIKQAVCNLMGQRSPAIWDAKFFTGMRRRRFFWGNIPGLQSVPYNRLHLEAEKTVLEDAIAIGSKRRQAMVTETRTITSSINSLTIQNGKKESVVTRGGMDSLLYSVEIERLFGFPKGYTDCGRVDINSRRKLLGKAWSVHVVRQILAPLRNYFLTRSD